MNTVVNWPLPRMRQVVLAVRDLEPALARIGSYLGGSVDLAEPYRDSGVDHFGLENAVFAIGDSFLEVLAPVRPDTAVGRHLARRGGDAGYMVMLQLPELVATRTRLAELDVRVVWQIELDDAVDLHLHPRDVPGALVAVDTMDPPTSWRWGGPAFTGRADPPVTGGLVGITVAVPDPLAAARRWAAVAGLAEPTEATLVLAGGGQRVEFVPASDTRNGLIAMGFALPGVTTRPDDLAIGDTVIQIYPMNIDEENSGG